MTAITSRDIRRDAEALSTGIPSEARRRAAASRAYFAAYHRCRAWVSHLPTPARVPESGSVHARLIDVLEAPNPLWDEHIAQHALALGQLMRKQRERRIHADYKLKLPFDNTMLEAQFDDVRKTFATCAESREACAQ
ncbi:hypothetical protein ACQ86G_12740 [Roseateles chitinivorans]|uniref:hypothetical protein n=1 Tax=Roseateles chitinivorans TaxID=2917965 RepID=UPI003D677CA5